MIIYQVWKLKEKNYEKRRFSFQIACKEQEKIHCMQVLNFEKTKEKDKIIENISSRLTYVNGTNYEIARL